MNELVSLQNQVQEVRLQDKLGEQKYHHKAEKLFEPVIYIIKSTSENISKSLTEKSINNNRAIGSLNKKFSEVMNDKNMIALYLASSLINLFISEDKSQFRLKEDLNSTKMSDFLINGGIPVGIYDNMLTFRGSNGSS